jgi:hypothetical protein
MSDVDGPAGGGPAPFFPPKPRRQVLPWVIAGVALLVAGVAAVFALTRGGSGGPKQSPVAVHSPKTITVHGALVLNGPISFGSEGSDMCGGLAGYNDVIAGAQVVVYDAAGKQLVVAALPAGTQGDNYFGNPLRQCWFTIDIPGVPAGVGPYSIEVTHRGKIPFEESKAYDVEMTLG